MLTVLHASDFQCGRPFRPSAAEAFLRLARDVSPDLVVVSGDLTQRAKRREYATAASILDRLPDVPVVITPGNHDVPLFRVWERLVSPYRNWREAMSPTLDVVTKVDGATFVALNSSAPRRAIVNGRLDPEQIGFAREAFQAADPSDVRVLVVHHHFVPVPDGTDGRTLPRASDLVRGFEAMGVDLVLGGHVHQTHIATSNDLLGERKLPGVPLVACGTTTSWRGRGPEKHLNSLNVVRIASAEIEILPHIMHEGGAAFDPTGPVVIARRPSYGAPASERSR